MKMILYILLLLAALLLVAVVRTLFLPKKTAAYEMSKDEARIGRYAEKLSKLVQYETVSHREDPEVEKFRGFHKVIEGLYPRVFNKLEKIEIDGNLMVRWPGRDPSLKPILMISHQDVVPAEGEWKYPPFSGIVADGKIWGRGTGDVKCGVMSFYQAVEELLEAGYEPACDVYLGSSCTEEIGGDGAPKMAKWFADRGIRLFLLSDEGGGLVKDPVSGVKGSFASIGIFEKGYGDLRFTARSRGGHSSTPPKNSPIVRLAKFEAAVEKRSPFKVKFSPAVSQMFENLAPYSENFGLRLVMHNLWLFKPILGKIMPAISAEAAAMLQTTVAFTMQKGSDGYNVLPQEAWVTANLRYIPHQKAEESNAIITDLAKKYGLETEVLKVNDPSSPLDLGGEAYAMVTETVREVFPNVGIMPYVVTGGTDSRFFEEVSDNSVRFSPVMYGPEQLGSMHGIDENLEIGCLPGAVDFYKALIRAQEKRKA